MPTNVLPASFTVVTAVELVPAPVEPGVFQYPAFARWTTTVRDGAGNWIAASGDETDAINQALGICQQRMEPYDSLTWPFP